VFAILTSRVVYWLWRVEGDGFHVSTHFLERLPFGRAIPAVQAAQLQELGRELWALVRERPVVSRNAGQVSASFSPLAFEGHRDMIDRVLVAAAGLESTFVEKLRQMVAGNRCHDDVSLMR
jgi:hypothetical protein